MYTSFDPALSGPIFRCASWPPLWSLLLLLVAGIAPTAYAQTITPAPADTVITFLTSSDTAGKHEALECPAQLILGQGILFQGQVTYDTNVETTLATQFRVNALFNVTDATTSLGTATVVESGADYAFGAVIGSDTINYTATLATISSGTATIEIELFQDGAPTSSDSCEIEIIELADLQVAKAAPTSVKIGDTFAYALAAFNGGPNASSDVLLIDPLPAEVTFVSASLAGCSADDQGQVTCELGNLDVGQQVNLSITVTATGLGTAVNTAMVSGPLEDPNTANNEVSVSTSITPAGITYEEASDVVIELIPEVCPVPEQAMTYLRTELLEAGDEVTPAFGSDSTYEITETQYFGWIDCDPYAAYGHLNGYVFVDFDLNGETNVIADDQAWPEINGIPFPTGLSIDLTSDELIAGEPKTSIPVEPINTVNTPVLTPKSLKACAILVSGEWNTETTWEEGAFDRDIANARDNFIKEQYGPRIPVERVFTLKNPTPDELDTFIRNTLPKDCDQIYFYYSGHGVQDTGALALDGADMGLPSLVSALLIHDAEFFIYHGGCHSGNVIQAVLDSYYLYQRRVTVVTAASSSRPTYFEDVVLPDGTQQYRLGFGYHFLLCFGDPAADTNNDGMTSFEEAFIWTRNQDPSFTFGDKIFSKTEPQIFTHRPLEVQKIVAESYVEAGDTFHYVITLTNPNPTTTARNVTLFDVLPFRTRYRNVTTTQGRCTVDTSNSISTIDCEVGDMAPGAMIEIRIEADAAQAGDATNTVRVGDLNATAELLIAPPPAFDLCGQKYIDANGNGVRDAGEPGGDGFVIELLNEAGVVIATATTAGEDTNNDGVIDETTERGRFCFTGLERGRYIVREAPRSGWRQTAPAAPGTYTVDLATGTHERILFGNTPVPATTTTICGFKFFDRNQNGVRDANEPGIDGFTIELLDANGVVIAQTTTGSEDLNGDGIIDPLTEQGRYCFKDLPPGTYTLREVVPTGWTQTAPVTRTYTFTVPSLELPDFDFGNYTEFKLDYGDLPDPCVAGGAAGRYPTLAPLGPAHYFANGPILGALADGEPNGQPNPFATGDDMAGAADEDGLLAIRATTGGNGALDMDIAVTIPAPLFGAFVTGWIDFNDDCQFNDAPFPAGERIFNALLVLNGLNVLTTPPGVEQPLGAGPKALRLRIHSLGGLPPTGLASNGEVEDYFIDLDGEDYGDAPSSVDPTQPEFPGGYPTTLAQNGARHAIDESFRLGTYVDADVAVDGQYDALEDDLNQQQDDEDGIRLLDGFGTGTHPEAGPYATLQPGQLARLLPLPSTDGRLDAWIDWNRDGDWDDDGEQIFASVDIGPNMDEDDALEIMAPSDASLGFTYARFRLSKQGGLAPTGFAITGEVEDMLLQVVKSINVSNEWEADLPSTFALNGNYPNPFNPETQISYEVARLAHVQLAVYNTLGQVVQVLVDEEQAPGTHQVVWNGRQENGNEVASGVYLTRMIVVDAQGVQYVQTKSMVLLR